MAVVGEKFIKKSTTVHFGFYISCYDNNIKVDVVSMISDEERNVSNFTEQGVFKCLYFIRIRFFGQTPKLKSVFPNRFKK